MIATVNRLTTNRRIHPLGIDTTPEFGWAIRGTRGQVAYAIEVARDESFAEDVIVWRSGRVSGQRPFGVCYAGAPLLSFTVYHWRVQLWLDDGERTPWSDVVRFETAVLDPGQWRASWITDRSSAHDRTPRTLYFRYEFELSAPVIRGRAYLSALGWYHTFANYTDLTGHALVPRWTALHQCVEYQTCDVTDVFAEGANVIGIVVAEGRYRGRNGITATPAVYGDRLAAFGQVELDLADGSSVTICTDDAWVVGGGRILSADPKFGERVDLRISSGAWLQPGAAPTESQPVTILTGMTRGLIAEEVERVEAIRRLRGTVSRTPSGVQLVDFGQNLAGVASVRLSGTAGETVTLAYGEVLTPNGELDTRYLEMSKASSLESWFQHDEAILDAETTNYTPWFTIHGFRYLAVAGLETPLADDDVEAVVLSTALSTNAQFRCSDRRLEQLHHNVEWSLRSNFVDTPTDCPTRERSGWTGDIQVFGPTASVLVDANNYLRRYLRNLTWEQYPDGRVPHAIPREPMKLVPGVDFGRIAAGSVGWGDVAVILPWTLYQYYGDTEILRRQYMSATAWVDSLQRRAATKRSLRRRTSSIGERERFIVDTGYHWGEWLRPGEGVAGSLVKNFITRHAEIATAYFAYSASLLSRIADTVGIPDDASHYRNLSDNVADAWRTAFVRDGGTRIGADRQDDYVRALAFRLLLPDQREPALHRLVELIEQAGDHLGTGFLSTPMLLAVLADNGRVDIAYRLLLQPTSPSWMAQIGKGATTIWETWAGYDKAGRAKSSHNHYAVGSVALWLHEYIAGLRPAEPGYRQIRITPHVGGGLTSASSTITTPYGMASSTWSVVDGTVRLDVCVPTGTTAEVQAGETVHRVAAGEHSFSYSSG